MRILVWHGWLLEGAGSNVYTARIVEVWRRQGHDVLLVCQERNIERFPFLDAGVDGGALGSLESPSAARAVLVRPDIGDLLPVFVYDDYEGFRVKTFVDLTDGELETYLERSVAALRDIAAWHGSDVVVAGHAFPGPVVARRALPDVPMVAKVHGSDIEYAMRPQARYVELAREGLEGAAAVAGASRDVVDRLVELVPSVAARTLVVNPGVEAERFRSMPRRDALLRTADLLEHDAPFDPGPNSPDAAAPARLRALAAYEGPLVGYLGKLIPQKGVDHLLEALVLLESPPRTLVVGYGTYRERLEALVLDRGLGDVVSFTGRLDHRYAPTAVAALDVLVVPSILEEAFGMVALEGTAAGALPLVARHSGLAEIAGVLEAEIGRPGLLSYEPGPGAVRDLSRALAELLAIPTAERRRLSAALSAVVRERWSWERTAAGLLDAVGTPEPEEPAGSPG